MRAALAPLRDALPAPLFDWTGEMAFTDVQGLFDPLLRPGMQWYWRGDFVRELPDEAIEAHVATRAASSSRERCR